MQLPGPLRLRHCPITFPMLTFPVYQLKKPSFLTVEAWVLSSFLGAGSFFSID